MTEDYYVYVYYHPKRGTPVYVGKGRGKRATSHRNDTHNLFFHDFLQKYRNAKPVIIETDLSEFEAYQLERKLISEYGRLVDSSGTLFNRTEGGDASIAHGHSIVFGGREFASLSELARAFGIKEGTLWSRLISLGWTLAEAAGQKSRRRVRKSITIQPITFRGKQYPSLAELARAYGVRPNLFHRHVRSGWPIPEALGLTEHKRPIINARLGREVTCNDKTYRSVKEFASKFDLDYHLVFERLRLGWTPEEIAGLTIRPQAGKAPQDVRAFGKSFPSVEHLARDPRCIVSSETLRRRMKKGLTAEAAATLPAHHSTLRKDAKPIKRHPLWKPISFGGKEYRSHKAMAKAFGVPLAVFNKRLYVKKWPIEMALGIKPVPRRVWSKGIQVAGRQYKSHKEAAAEFGISVNKFNGRLSHGWTPEEAAGLKKRQKPPIQWQAIHIRGMTYPSVSDAARAYGFKPNEVFSRMNIGWSIEEALGLVKRNVPKGAKSNPLWHRVVAEGVEYKSISAAAKAYGVSYSSIYGRLKKGWPLEKALKEPLRRKRQL